MVEDKKNLKHIDWGEWHIWLVQIFQRENCPYKPAECRVVIPDNTIIVMNQFKWSSILGVESGFSKVTPHQKHSFFAFAGRNPDACFKTEFTLDLYSKKQRQNIGPDGDA